MVRITIFKYAEIIFLPWTKYPSHQKNLSYKPRGPLFLSNLFSCILVLLLPLMTWHRPLCQARMFAHNSVDLILDCWKTHLLHVNYKISSPLHRTVGPSQISVSTVCQHLYYSFNALYCNHGQTVVLFQ